MYTYSLMNITPHYSTTTTTGGHAPEAEASSSVYCCAF